LFLVGVCLCITWALAIDKEHIFKDEDVVPLFVNKVGPYANPSESYEFYSLPLCRPKKVQHEHHTLGEKLEGDRKQTSAYEIRFKVPVRVQTLCPAHFKSEEIAKLRNAVAKYYYYELVVDDLPIRGFVGAVDSRTKPAAERKLYLFTHTHFTVFYNQLDNNNGVVIYANITADPSKVVELKEGTDDLEVTFTYSVAWVSTDIEFDKRTQLQSITSKSELEIHWLSILNSFVLVILLTGFIAIIIMRILKSDYSRYARDEEEDNDAEDYGWKLIHGDVFRFPPNKLWLSAFVGVGAQFVTMAVFTLFLAVVGIYYPGNDGALQVSSIVLYALTAGVAGFVATRLYVGMEAASSPSTAHAKWSWVVMLTAAIFGLPVFGVVTFLNIVAAYYGVTSALSFTTILSVLSIWVFVGLPLTLLGGVAGKRLATPFYTPVRTKNFPREIPAIPWYRKLPYQMLMAGFLPFSAIYIELFYIFNSVWGRSSYQLFGILCLVFIILLIVTACITIALTYFQLSMEDYRWWWHSFLNGGSTGLFIYGYSFFYFNNRSQMSGFLQGTFYFGYMAVICYFFFIMLGTVGWFSSLVFVRRIYRSLHTD
jgi:hypothetical protein